jgi:hypothetical protein
LPGFVVEKLVVAEQEDLDAFVIALHGAHGTGEYLELEKAHALDEQDVVMGMNTYCTVTDAGACQYGGIVACVLEPASLVLEFTEPAAATLGLPAHLELTLHRAGEDLGKLRAGLLRMFGEDLQRPARLVV